MKSPQVSVPVVEMPFFLTSKVTEAIPLGATLCVESDLGRSSVYTKLFWEWLVYDVIIHNPSDSY